ncbi:MAG: DUF4112 domain-containing protein [Marinicellaceae bacterium]
MSIENRKELKNKLNKLAWLSDSSIKLPGKSSKFSIGLDSIIGLIPVIGDFSSALISCYIMLVGLRAKVPKLIILRMSFTVLWDTTIGAIPLFGDIYDMFFKANERNVKLLEKYIDDPENTEHSTQLWVVLLILFILSCAVFLLWLVWATFQWILALF